jgi:hypothetical protein
MRPPPGLRNLRGLKSLLLLLVLLNGPVLAGGEEKPAAKDGAKAQRRKAVPTEHYAQRSVEGWTIHVNQELLKEKAELGSKALRLLETKLYEIRRVVPKGACAELQKVPIWLGINDGHAPCAEYHPSKDWLAEHGYNPDKARAVEIGNAERFLEWSITQPAMILHELAHAYHDRVLGFDHAGIQEAFRSAKDGKLYEAVLRGNGKKERAYALTNDREYFAEGTEAFFGTNDFYPFVRAELQEHDPRLHQLLREVWNR